MHLQKILRKIKQISRSKAGIARLSAMLAEFTHRMVFKSKDVIFRC